MGGFHIAINYLSLLGKKNADSGIEDLLIESGVYGSGTASQILKGSSSNRGVRAHKLVMEAMFRLQWNAFVIWLEDSDNNIDQDAVAEVARSCREAVQSGTNLDESLGTLAETKTELATLFTVFKTETRSKLMLFAFWDDYIIMVQLLLQFIRAERTIDWNLHLSATASMTPHVFAMDRQNYSWWLPIYLADMDLLPQVHPVVYHEFMSGNHAISRSSQTQVWTDMALEQSINLDSKTNGGIIGISQKPGTLESSLILGPTVRAGPKLPL